MVKTNFKLPKNYITVPIIVSIILVIILVTVLSTGTCNLGKNNHSLVEGFQNNLQVKQVKRPFVNLYDNYGNRLNVIGISKPFSDDSNEKEYNEYKKILKRMGGIGYGSKIYHSVRVSKPLVERDMDRSRSLKN